MLYIIIYDFEHKSTCAVESITTAAGTRIAVRTLYFVVMCSAV